MQSLLHYTLARLVSEHPGLIPVLARYGLDTNTHGPNTLAEACRTLGLDPAEVALDISQALRSSAGPSAPVPETAGELTRYITELHHALIKKELPLLQENLETLCKKYSSIHPGLQQLMQNFSALREELEMHLQKEELILFPRIREMEDQKNTGKLPAIRDSYLHAPLLIMEHEHRDMLRLMADIRREARLFQPPPEAERSWQLTLSALEQFEQDLHRPILLENKRLFPLAAALLPQASNNPTKSVD